MPRFIALLALLAGCGADPASAARPPAAPRSLLRVATWNVHDLFDEVDRTSPPGELDTVLSPAEVEAKLARLGRVLARADADVVVLEEVENLALLQRLAAGPLAGGGYAAYLVEGFDPRGIDVGVLSRAPVVRYVSHLEDRDVDGAHLWSRDCVEVHVGGAARPVVLLGNHLVSRLDPAQDGRRARQAARVRAIADALRREDPARLVVVLGDLNDVAGSAALAPLLADGALLDVGAALAPDVAWTWSGGGARERIDYAAVPREDAAAVADAAVLAGDDVAAASDHRPLIVDLWAQ
jgi:endonuclease/exonuclease/phosphatase family metal-dependent hydrolase